VHCTTREDLAFKHWMTECSDGSQAVTRYNEQVKQWRTEVTKPGAASQENKAVEKQGRKR